MKHSNRSGGTNYGGGYFYAHCECGWKAEYAVVTIEEANKLWVSHQEDVEDGYYQPERCLCGTVMENREACCTWYECGTRHCRKKRGGTNEDGFEFAAGCLRPIRLEQNGITAKSGVCLLCGSGVLEGNQHLRDDLEPCRGSAGFADHAKLYKTDPSYHAGVHVGIEMMRRYALDQIGSHAGVEVSMERIKDYRP